jgi:hypothetical protein
LSAEWWSKKFCYVITNEPSASTRVATECSVCERQRRVQSADGVPVCSRGEERCLSTPYPVTTAHPAPAGCASSEVSGSSSPLARRARSSSTSKSGSPDASSSSSILRRGCGLVVSRLKRTVTCARATCATCATCAAHLSPRCVACAAWRALRGVRCVAAHLVHGAYPPPISAHECPLVGRPAEGRWAAATGREVHPLLQAKAWDEHLRVGCHGVRVGCHGA